MSIDLDAMPLTVGDLVRIMPTILIEVLAQSKKTSAEADRALEEIATRLADIGAKTTNERPRIILSAIAQLLMATEDGG